MTKNQLFMIAAIALTVIMIAWRIYGNARRSRLTNQLTGCLMAGDFDGFDQLADDPATSRIIYPFNLAYVRLNSYLMRNDGQKATEAFDQLRSFRLTEAQKLEVAQLGFNYFISLPDEERAGYYHDVINSVSGHDAMKENVNTIYEIIVEKKTDRLQQLLDINESLDEALRSSNEFLISEIYRNMGDEKNSQKYEKLAKQHLEAYERKVTGR
ncbi:MAG: hypothetical protein IKX74_07565 [Erysipelotrichaceae bacterium]|nr:hypothetical protein [Erysipelotrichaceae bacterium]